MKKILIFILVISAAAFSLAEGKREAMKAEPAVANISNEVLSSDQLQEIIDQQDPNTFLVDVRTPEEYASGAIPTAVNIPVDVIRDNPPTQDRSARIIVYCRSGNRSRAAKSALEALGFKNVNDFGGIANWQGELVVR